MKETECQRYRWFVQAHTARKWWSQVSTLLSDWSQFSSHYRISTPEWQWDRGWKPERPYSSNPRQSDLELCSEMVEFSSLILHMKRWEFGEVKSIQHHTVVCGRARICIHLNWSLKSRVFTTSGYSQEWKSQLLCRWRRPWLGGPGGLDGKKYTAQLILWTASHLWSGPSQPPSIWDQQAEGDAASLKPLCLFRQSCLRKCMQTSYGEWPLSRLHPVLILQLENLWMWGFLLWRL